MKRFFVDHPKSVNETYFQHLRFAFKSGILMLIGGIACIIHAFFPFAFVTYGSSTVSSLANNFSTRCKNKADKHNY